MWNVSLYVSHGKECHSIDRTEEGIVVTLVEDLSNHHEEGDTRVILHAMHASELYHNIFIHTPDTDVVILAACLLKIPNQTITVVTGVKNKLCFLNINEMQKKWDHVLNSLIGFHAFTGTDCSSAFRGKGKVKPFKLMCSSDECTSAFENIGKDFSELS